ncbi:multidrug transporter [Herbiconiux moechotypicola]|uniref:Multidrug transporter n=1 Tax=Herbiconiux moechotypicola TaxID=637393 RepID=A0ABP5Q9J0_9MICO|nr:multidrug transporter [Herbiconiux moechotypicola]MCS5729238.1 multidrug transporter [Herbiconiux moechotypicola]
MERNGHSPEEPTEVDRDDFESKRHDQLTAAPKSTEDDAEPRIDVTSTDHGTTRIDVRDDAEVRPGGDRTSH